MTTLSDTLTIKIADDFADPSADVPADMDNIPEYSDFFNRHELYQRIHVHLVGVKPKIPGDSDAGLRVGNIFNCFFPRRQHEGVNASATVEAYGPNTGSGKNNFFPIGKHSWLPKRENSTPIWDARNMIVCKKGSENTEGIKIAVLNSHEELFSCKLSAADFPAIGEDWKEYVFEPQNSHNVEDVVFVYQIRITDGADKIGTKDALVKSLTSKWTVSYSAEPIEAKNGNKMDNALLQIWKQTKTSDPKAVLWFLGRNDCFMHPHVMNPLFVEKGYDVYVLNYSCDGMCRQRGWLDDPHFNAHNSVGDFDLYLDQVEGAIDIMKASNYGKVLGYAHSTGAPVLMNYLMKRGDSFFDGFVFNSPFMDWSADAVGSELLELVVEHTGIATRFTSMTNDSKMGVATTPEEIKDTPVNYMGQEIHISAWSAKIWSQFFYDFRARPLYDVPMTPGFAKGVTKVHEDLAKYKKNKKAVSLKPFMCITSRADDTLTASETLEKIDTFGPNRYEMELHYNSHDIFLSEDKIDVDLAVNLTKVWMESKGFE